MPGWVEYLLEGWNWREILATASIVFVSFVAARAFAALVEKAGHRWARRTASSLDDYVLDAVRRPVSLLIFLAGVSPLGLCT